MTTDVPPTNMLVVGPEKLSPPIADALFHGAAMAEVDSSVIGVSGSGTIMCMQGMLTNDIEGPGNHGFVFGATLTAKGMIVTDLWVARQDNDVHLFVPPEGTEPLLEVFRRSLPPRLACPEDYSEEISVLRLVGPEACDLARDAELDIPEPGQTSTVDLGGPTCRIARPEFELPFSLQLACDAASRESLVSVLDRVGVVRAEGSVLEAARVMAGWPRLGAEIDSKTLPQEVRFDEISGVSYTKGCYTGQETVARVHFRGRANRWLAGLTWDAEPDPEVHEIVQDGKAVGRVSTVVWLPDPTQVIGLGVVRREVGDDSDVIAAGAPARICVPPFELD